MNAIWLCTLIFLFLNKRVINNSKACQMFYQRGRVIYYVRTLLSVGQTASFTHSITNFVPWPYIYSSLYTDNVAVEVTMAISWQIAVTTPAITFNSPLMINKNHFTHLISLPHHYYFIFYLQAILAGYKQCIISGNYRFHTNELQVTDRFCLHW